ncbi:5522_t:CDS:1, partial [Funneliformis mosseae]
MTYKYQCCKHTFAFPYTLKWHISAKHQFIINENEDEMETESIIPNEEPDLWDKDFIIDYSE